MPRYGFNQPNAFQEFVQGQQLAQGQQQQEMRNELMRQQMQNQGVELELNRFKTDLARDQAKQMALKQDMEMGMRALGTNPTPEAYKTFYDTLTSKHGVPSSLLAPPDQMQKPEQILQYVWGPEIMKAKIAAGKTPHGIKSWYNPKTGAWEQKAYGEDTSGLVPESAAPVPILDAQGNPTGKYAPKNAKFQPQPMKPTLLQDKSGKLIPWYPNTPIPEGASKPTVTTATPEVLGQLFDGLKTGKIPPSMLSKRASDYNRILAMASKEGLDMSLLERQYKAESQLARSLNTAQALRLRTLGNTMVQTIDRTRELANEMQLSGIKPLNYVTLKGLTEMAGNTPQGVLATKYMTQVNALKEELGQMIMGGYAPTDSAFHLADKMLRENFGVGQMQGALDEIQKLTRYRMHAIEEVKASTGGGLQSQSPGGAKISPQQASYNRAKAQLDAMPPGPAKDAAAAKMRERLNQLRQMGMSINE